MIKECSSLDYLQSFNEGRAKCSAVQSLKRKAGAGEPPTPLADEFEYVLAHWAVGGLWAKGRT